MPSYLTHLECTQCGRIYATREKQTTCHYCHSLLFARYGLCQVSQGLNRAELDHRQNGIWRWHELLPVQSGQYRLTLGEADTPLVCMTNSGKKLGIDQLYCKDESSNPAGSYMARGACIALSKAAELGVQDVAIPTAGDEGAAVAYYATRQNINAHIYMPKQSSLSRRNEIISLGGHLHLIDGDLSDAAIALKEDNRTNHWYNLTDLQEPYRLEGDKTIGYEIARQMDWDTPDWILFPSDGGNGIVGLWKAFTELLEIEWITRIPRIVWVQTPKSIGSTTFQASENPDNSGSAKDPSIVFADNLISGIIKDNSMLIIAVPEEGLEVSVNQLMADEGILCSHEVGASFIALQKLLQNGTISKNERIVLINTASGLKNF
jgi:threonine synthase